MPIDKETEYKALKACLSGNHCIDGCPLLDSCVGLQKHDSARVLRLLELHGEMVAREIAEDLGYKYYGLEKFIDIAKSVGKE